MFFIFIMACLLSMYLVGYLNGQRNTKEGTPSASHNTAMLQLLCSIDKYLDETNCDVEPGDPFHTKIKAVIAQQQHS